MFLSRLAHLLAAGWADAGPMLDRCWADAGPMLDRCWTDAGPMLDRRRSHNSNNAALKHFETCSSLGSLGSLMDNNDNALMDNNDNRLAPSWKPEEARGSLMKLRKPDETEEAT